MPFEYSAHGTTIEYDSDGMPTWVAIPQVGEISGPDDSAEIIEVTHHGSSSRREYVAGLKDGGEVTFPLVWDPADTSHQWLEDNLGTTQDFRITFSDTGTTAFTFSAVIIGTGKKAPVDDKLEMEVKLKITGAVTRA